MPQADRCKFVINGSIWLILKPLFDIESCKTGRKGRNEGLSYPFKSEILLAGVAKNDHKKGSNNFCHGGIPAKMIHKEF